MKEDFEKLKKAIDELGSNFHNSFESFDKLFYQTEDLYSYILDDVESNLGKREINKLKKIRRIEARKYLVENYPNILTSIKQITSIVEVIREEVKITLNEVEETMEEIEEIEELQEEIERRKNDLE